MSADPAPFIPVLIPGEGRAPGRRSKLLFIAALVVAGAALAWTACAIADTVVVWRRFSNDSVPDFTFASFLASRLFGLVRESLPLKYEGYLQALLVLSWPCLAALAALFVWFVRRRRAGTLRGRRALSWTLAALLACVPAAGIASYAVWQCVFVSPKEIFERRLARQARRERREPTTDEMARASDMGYDYDEWRRKSFLRLFLPYRPEPAAEGAPE